MTNKTRKGRVGRVSNKKREQGRILVARNRFPGDKSNRKTLHRELEQTKIELAKVKEELARAQIELARLKGDNHHA